MLISDEVIALLSEIRLDKKISIKKLYFGSKLKKTIFFFKQYLNFYSKSLFTLSTCRFSVIRLADLCAIKSFKK